MLSRFVACVALAAATLDSLCRADGFVTESEVGVARTWAAEQFSGDIAKLPFSFKLGELNTADVLARSNAEVRSEALDAQRTQRTLTWNDPHSGLEIKAVAVEYSDYPEVEWTVHFKNVGEKDTPVLWDIRALDVNQSVPAEASTILHHNKGSRAAPNDFEPYEMGLPMRTEAAFRSAGGRPTNGSWPYFNVNWGDHGLIVAMGWPGQWITQFERDGAGGLAIRGGQETTHFKLLPGESVRTPLIALQWYEGDWVRGQNVWRRWMVAHNVPRVEGKLPDPQLLANSSHQFAEMMNANEENQKEFISRYVEEKFPLKYWWMDAGWYVNDGVWTTTGTWEVDKKRFPNGLRAVTDHGRSLGVKSIVWFEPERVAPNSWLYNERKEWLLTPPPNPGDQLYDVSWRLLNLGNKECREWLTQHINAMIDKEGIDLYRQDFNMDPVMYWQNGEAEDRQGINENLYVQGYLAYWDGLLAPHPQLRIDTCASGGRRLDLETLRRSAPLVRSDCLFEPTGQQAHTYGISLWLPYHGTGTLVGKSAIGLNTDEGVREYDFRSHMAVTLTTAWDMRDKNLDYDKLRRLTAEFMKIAPLYMADYYPITPHTLAPTDWIAWQFNDPEKGIAVVQSFRREQCTHPEMALKLSGLDPSSQYQISALGTDESWQQTGAELMDRGLISKLPEQRSAGLYYLTKVQLSAAN
jgi:alpha-galactosidase